MSVPSGRIRKIAAAAVACLLCFAIAGAEATGEERFGRRKQMLALTNDDRAANDRRALAFAERLSHYAKAHSQEMAERGHLFHSTGDQLRTALEGYHWELGGENIGVGGSLEGLEEAFMASRPHRQNLLRKIYEHAAFGIVHEDGQYWVTVIFYG